MGNTLLHTADIFRILQIENEAVRRLAMAAIADEIAPKLPEQIRAVDKRGDLPTPVKETIDVKTEEVHESKPVPFWQPVHYRWRADSESATATFQELTTSSGASDAGEVPVLEPVRHTPLASSAVVVTELRKHSRLFREGSDPHIERVVDSVARGEWLARLPRVRKAAWGHRLLIVQDRSTRLIPYHRDHGLIIHAVAKLYPKGGIDCAHVTDNGLIRNPYPEHSNEFALPPPGVPVLVLGDLGVLAVQGDSLRDHWAEWGRMLSDRRNPAVAILPTHRRRVPSRIAEYWNVIPFGASPTQIPAAPGVTDQKLVAELLTMASPATRLEPGLLRAIRMLHSVAKDDPGWEALLWQDPAIISRHIDGATLDSARQVEFRRHFEQLPPSIRVQVLELIERCHAPNDFLLWAETVIALRPASRRLLATGKEELVIQRLKAFVDKGLPDEDLAITAWATCVVEGTSDAKVDDPRLRQALNTIHSIGGDKGPSARTPEWFDPAQLERGKTTITLNIRQQGGELAFVPVQVGDNSPRLPGSHIGFLRTTNRELRIDTEWRDALSSAVAPPPSWASKTGTDQYGQWAEFVVKVKRKSVTQRMRWIPPGSFLMGSPKSDKEAFDDERPQHKVTLTQGYWLFDTPCTQELWMAVMGRKNQSHFKGDQQPVGQVSFEDVAGQFLMKLNERVPGLELQLPTEAQWEYACRAGTDTPRYGPIDEVAWYWVNSAQQKHEVGLKRANGWGLFDMLGNVWEWCADWFDGYASDDCIDPTGPEAGSKRLMRGGCWDDSALRVRAAQRLANSPGNRGGGLGFRCLSSGRSQEKAGVDRAAEVGGQKAEPGRLPEQANGTTRLVIRDTEPAIYAMPRMSSIRILSDVDELILKKDTPKWAIASGRDKYGLWAEFEVQAVRQRMRWIPPGRFQMGSPPTENGRDVNEEPQHEVTITQGYWLFDTPCTQELWLAVMGGDNPSYFPDPKRPVEQVSFEEVEKFLVKFNKAMSGLVFALPTEAQWEYACRAGTTTATYAGDLEILGQNNVPLLDPIAWYGGNSGREYELTKYFNTNYWPEKQYPDTEAGTRRVGMKRANGWGLYDMLGNVWEWCGDWYDPNAYQRGDCADPVRPAAGYERVIRGGSWSAYALLVRAARRYAFSPEYRNFYLGFRCLISGLVEEAKYRSVAEHA